MNVFLRFIYPRPLHGIETLTAFVAMAVLVVASIMTDRDGWFSALAWWLFQAFNVYVMLCVMASIYRTAWFVRKMREHETVFHAILSEDIGDLRLSMPNPDLPHEEFRKELDAEFEKRKSQIVARRDAARAVITRMEETLKAWKEHP